MKDLIPWAVICIGKEEVAFIQEPNGVIVGTPFGLDNSKPAHLLY